MIVWVVFCAAALMAGAVLFAVWPCRVQRGLRAPFQNRNFAHRGLFAPDQSVPENSIPAFEAAARAGYGIELDVQLTKDRQLVVFHDDTLERMTPAAGFVHDMDYADFAALPLMGTAFHPPRLVEMLAATAAVDPATPLIVEIKSRREYRGAYLDALCRATLDALHYYPGPWCIESFDPRVVARIRKMAPGVLRGQLADCYEGYRGEGAPAPYAYAVSHCFGNFLGRPHFIAWCPAKRNWAVRLCARLGAMMVMWTALPDHDRAALERDNDAVIFQWYTPQPRFGGAQETPQNTTPAQM